MNNYSGDHPKLSRSPSLAETARFGAQRWWEKYGLGYLFLLPTLIIFAIFVFYPMINTIQLSFYNARLNAVETRYVGLENYDRLLFREGHTSREMLSVIQNTFVFTFGCLALQFLVGFTTSVILDRLNTFGNYIRGFLLVSWVTPAVVTAFIWRLILSAGGGILNTVLLDLGLIDEAIPWLARGDTAMWSLIIANTWRGFPFWMMMISAGMKNINREIYDAAKVDGASGLQVVWFVTIPLLRLTLFVTSTLSFIWTFNNFELIYGMTGGGPLDTTRTIPVHIYETAFVGFRSGNASAAAVMLLIMMSVAILMYMRLLKIDGGRMS